MAAVFFISLVASKDICIRAWFFIFENTIAIVYNALYCSDTLYWNTWPLACGIDKKNLAMVHGQFLFAIMFLCFAKEQNSKIVDKRIVLCISIYEDITEGNTTTIICLHALTLTLRLSFRWRSPRGFTTPTLTVMEAYASISFVLSGLQLSLSPKVGVPPSLLPSLILHSH